MYHVGLDLDVGQIRQVKRLALDENITHKALLTRIITDYLKAHPVDQASSREQQTPATRKQKQ